MVIILLERSAYRRLRTGSTWVSEMFQFVEIRGVENGLGRDLLGAF